MTATELGVIVTHYVNRKGDTVSQKKLQKLLYYVEAWNLVHLATPLINEDFQAWVHGPVLPSLYQQLKPNGFNDLKLIVDETGTPDKMVKDIIKKNKLTRNQLELINSVLMKYGRLTSFQLEMLSHSEKPWLDARNGCPPHQRCTNIIPKNEMKAYYGSLIAANE